jgi:RHS repeat-associated protein
MTGADKDTLTFAYNAEEYNPVTKLTYLIARYYAPDTANFITRDTTLGSLVSINSQNRYSYAEADPVNNADPSGHSITSGAYERQIEAAGGINEIYNFYVGRTLENSHNQAAGAFYSRLNYAYGVDYRSLYAINSITGISQATADAYITAGAVAALSVGATYGCAPGALTGAAIGTFASQVQATKDSVNTQISAVKANKQVQYQQYQAYLAWVAEQERLVAQQARLQAQLKAYGNNYLGYLRVKYNIPSPYNNDYVLNTYGNSNDYAEFQKLTQTASSAFYGGSSFTPPLSRVYRPYSELDYKGQMHDAVVDYLAVKHGLLPEEWNTPLNTHRYDLLDPSRTLVWEVKPVTYLPTTYFHERLRNQMSKYLLDGLKPGPPLGNEKLMLLGYDVSIYSDNLDGYVYYDFSRERQRQEQEQQARQQLPAESSYAVNPFTQATSDYYTSIPTTNGSGAVFGIGLVIGGTVIIVATLAEDVATGGAGIADDPASIGLGWTMIQQGGRLAFAF